MLSCLTCCANCILYGFAMSHNPRLVGRQGDPLTWRSILQD